MECCSARALLADVCVSPRSSWLYVQGGGRLVTFSPCVEQLHKTLATAQEIGFQGAFSARWMDVLPREFKGSLTQKTCCCFSNELARGPPPRTP